MSLDVSLYTKDKTKKMCYSCGHESKQREEVYSANITHNLGKMADKAGIYYHLWRPDELRIRTAKRLIKPLEKGLALLKEKPEYFSQFNAENGWGMYEHFVPFVEQYLNACKEYPNAKIETDR
jgi:hypothetical protein